MTPCTRREVLSLGSPLRRKRRSLSLGRFLWTAPQGVEKASITKGISQGYFPRGQRELLLLKRTSVYIPAIFLGQSDHGRGYAVYKELWTASRCPAQPGALPLPQLKLGLPLPGPPFPSRHCPRPYLCSLLCPHCHLSPSLCVIVLASVLVSHHLPLSCLLLCHCPALPARWPVPLLPALLHY